VGATTLRAPSATMERGLNWKASLEGVVAVGAAERLRERERESEREQGEGVAEARARGRRRVREIRTLNKPYGFGC